MANCGMIECMSAILVFIVTWFADGINVVLAIPTGKFYELLIRYFLGDVVVLEYWKHD